ncbi:MAG: hypothetical protein WC156_01100, partial [Pedobacter sp.]
DVFKYDSADDSGVLLSKPNWGYTKGGKVYQPYDNIFPPCSKPFILIISDVNTSYDADKIPGSSYANGLIEENRTPHLGLGDTLPNGKTVLNDMMDTISATEGISGNSWLIGESTHNGAAVDFICSSKIADNLQGVLGICPEEPTKKGSYYAAALAYYGKIKTRFHDITGHGPVSTFVVALSSPFADINIKAGENNVKIVPVGKTVRVNGVTTNKCLGYNGCTYSTEAISGRLIFKDCPSDSFCPTNSLVGWFINDIKYNDKNEIIYMKFRQNFEDSEQGADYDMDAIATYEICTSAAATLGYGSCGSLKQELVGNKLQINVTSSYAAGGADQVLGYYITGTAPDENGKPTEGTYYVVRDKYVPSSSPVYTMPLVSKLKFTSSSNPSAGNLKNPLWYAAKWGGFTGEGTPDTISKWDRKPEGKLDGNPDNYFPVNNPLKLDEQLEAALTAILDNAASGTAASMINNSEGSGANLLQALFYPKKTFDNGTEVNWIGEIHNLWYYLDPNLQRSSIREDSTQDFTLNLKNDKIASFFVDKEQITRVNLYSDADGDGVADNLSKPDDPVLPEKVHSLWQAGRMLWNRDVTQFPRKIYTGYDSFIGNEPKKISDYTANTGFQDLLQIPVGDTRNTATTALVNYIQGIDQAGMRGRKVSIQNCGPLDSCTREWKLGDIISSSPKQISNIRLNSYSLMPPTGYGDSTYQLFVNSDAYKHRGMIFAGGNDGMLHAFRFGILKELSERYSKAMLTNSSGAAATASDLLGNEDWAFIPKNSLPYLKYLSDPNYGHLFFVDKTVSTLDASIGVNSNSAACQADYSQCTKDASAWRTVLVGGMGIGGAVKPFSDSCTVDDCVKTPIADYGYSSYFALDVTDPAAPKYLWEFSPAGLGFTTTGPALVRIATKNAAGTGPDNSKNGKWFAVFASGPTGPIDTKLHEFKGQSDQELKIFIVDLATGTLVKTINTGILNAFAGSLASSWIDTDRTNTASTGYYSDDAIYIGYVKKDTVTDTWTKGGIGRLSTRESPDPGSNDATKQWAWSTLIDNTGPVTTSISKLQDRKNKNLWIYFGTGRYFYKEDDKASQNVIYGVKEPCYSTSDRFNRSTLLSVAGGSNNDIDQNCTDAVPSDLIDQSGDTPSSTIAAKAPGWFFKLDLPEEFYYSERLITDPIASPAGAVFFTTFKPVKDICEYGGQSHIWSANYATGGAPLAAAMKGNVLMQVSTGAFVETPLSSAFNAKGGRRTDNPISGMPPSAQGLSLIANPPPVKKFLHVREK